MKGIVRLNGKGRQGIGVELFRADATEDLDLTESESESIGEANESTAVMRVYENIGEDFFTGKGVTAKKFAKELNALGNIRELNVHINCLGGDCFTAQAIHNIIRDYGAETKRTYIDGVCASAATVIACAADEVIARNNSVYMVHLPWAVNIGNAASMRRAADQLDTLTTPIVNVYKQQVKGRIREAKIRALMEAETWMTAEEALDYGFVDKVRGSIKALAKASPFALLVNDEIMDVGKYHYRNLPDYPLVDKKESAEYQMIERERKRESMVEDKPITRETLPPGVVAQIQEEARQGERGRLAALDAMRMPGLEELIEAAKKDGRQPADIVMEAFNLIREERGRDEVVAAMHRDGSFNLRAGDAPMNKVEDKNQRAVNLMVEAFAKNGRRTK